MNHLSSSRCWLRIVKTANILARLSQLVTWSHIFYADNESSLALPDLVWSRMTPSHFSSHYDIPLPVEAIINLFEIIQKCPAWAWPGAMSVWGVRNVIDVLYTHLAHQQSLYQYSKWEIFDELLFSYTSHLTPHSPHLTLVSSVRCVTNTGGEASIELLYLETRKSLVSIISDLISSPGGNWTVRTHLAIHHQYQHSISPQGSFVLKYYHFQ